MSRRPRVTVLHGRPLRVRLTVAFASVVALVLAVTGMLVYVEFARDLDRRTDEELAERQAAITGLAISGRPATQVLALSGERLAQLYAADGALVRGTAPVARVPLLSPAEVRRAARRPLLLTRTTVAGTDDGARLRAFALAGGRVAVIGEARDDRERELHRLALLLALALPAALALSSLAGYQVARAALDPVERMRARAASIGAGEPGGRLPAPGTRDELDRLASTLNDLLERLESALERERRIVGDASHELRTPISVLRTRIDVALRAAPDPTADRAALEGVRDDAERLGRLADDLLVLARADQGQLTLRLAPLDVEDLLGSARDRHADALGTSGRTLTVTGRVDGGAVVLADPDRVAQILDNLVVNAHRYGSGAVELSAAPADGGTAVELAIRDHGPGFTTGFLPHAFERFSQADDSHGGAGSGLGLAIVQALARAHGGDALAANDPGGGARVSVTLPRA